MEEMEGGYSEQIAVTKGSDAQTACGSFPGMYTRLDDPEVFRWMQRVISGTMIPATTTPEPDDTQGKPNDTCDSDDSCEGDYTCSYGRYIFDEIKESNQNSCFVFRCRLLIVLPMCSIDDHCDQRYGPGYICDNQQCVEEPDRGIIVSFVRPTRPIGPIDNPCNPDPCGSNADCENDDNRAVCRCRNGYDGNSLSSLNTDIF